MFCSQHEDYVFGVIDFIKEPPGPDSISPCFGVKAFQFLYIGSIKDLKLTALHVTHDQEEAMSISDRVIVMKKGRIIEEGAPMNLYTRPEKLFTANFVGEANFLKGVIIEKSDNTSLVEIGDGLKLIVNNGKEIVGERDSSRLPGIAPRPLPQIAKGLAARAKSLAKDTILDLSIPVILATLSGAYFSSTRRFQSSNPEEK